MITLKEALESLRTTTLELDSAGPAPSFTVPEYHCSICRNTGWVYRDGLAREDAGFGKAHPCVCRKLDFDQRRHEALMKFSGLPDAEQMTFVQFLVKPQNEDAYNAALSLLNGDIRFLTFIGQVNTGKTHLAVAVCREYINLNIPAKYAFTPMFLDEIRAGYAKDAEYSFPALFLRYCDVPLLVLDDLYRQKPTAWGSEKLMELINVRYMAKTPTIFTTNKSFEEIKQIDKEQGEAITSRLQREKWCRVCVL